MEMLRAQLEESSINSPRYARFTEAQVEVLEKVYFERPMPNLRQRQRLGREFPVLADIEERRLKTWFQNRRCRQKQLTVATKILIANQKLTSVNDVLRGENERLQKQVTLLVSEVESMRQQGTAVNGGTTGTVKTTPQHSLRDTSIPAGLLAIAEETLAVFLSKATAIAVDWVQIPGMENDPDSIRILATTRRGSGIAARTCGVVNLDATKIIEILKDRPRWCQDCRKIEVFTTTPADNGGIIELVYTQNYSPATLAQARDYWSLRYTTTLENGSVVVCERSLSGSGVGPDSDTSLQFVRGEMLPSGYMVTPCLGGGSIIHIVDHINLQAGNVNEMLRPLYESSKVVARRMTMAALKYVRQIAKEAIDGEDYSAGKELIPIFRNYSEKLRRGFNDAINGFSEDGLSLFNCNTTDESNATDEVIITVKPTITTSSSSSNHYHGSVLCAKASVILKNVPPAELLRYLREHRSEWADFNIESYCATAMKVSCYPPPTTMNTRLSMKQIKVPLGHTIEHEQILEVIRESIPSGEEDSVNLGDVHILQTYCGTKETSIGAYTELLFAPIAEMFPDDEPLLPSGFRIIPLSVEPGPFSRHGQSTISNGTVNAPKSYAGQAILTMAFQFPIGENIPKLVAIMARQYVHSVISSVRKASAEVAPLRFRLEDLARHSPGSPDPQTLAQSICQSYSHYVGGGMLSVDWLGGDEIFNNFLYHHHAIVCCSLKEKKAQLIFANQAGLNMLKTTPVGLQNITLDEVMSDSAWERLIFEFPRIIKQGCSFLPYGEVSTPSMTRPFFYDEAIAWKVFVGDGVGDVFVDHLLAIAFLYYPMESE